ncbi:DUF3592 domain-containing protein [Saccharomonospora sp. NPDC006951]
MEILLRLIVPGVFFAVGLGFAAMGSHLLRGATRLARTGLRVPGEVTGMRYNTTSEIGRGSYYPVLSFRTLDGRDLETASDIGTDPPMAHEGDQVTVVYDPFEPHTARIDSAVGKGSLVGWACVAGGGVLVVLSVLGAIALL